VSKLYIDSVMQGTTIKKKLPINQLLSFI